MLNRASMVFENHKMTTEIVSFLDLQYMHILARVSKNMNSHMNKNFSISIDDLMKNEDHDYISQLDKQLIVATMLGHYGEALKALQRGANVNVKVYLDKESDIFLYPLHFAARSGNLELIKLLIANSAIFKPDAPQKYYLSPLHYAAGGDNTHCIAFFLDLGIPVDQQSTICSPYGWNWTALQTCSNHGNFTGVSLLMERGANIHLKDPDEYQAVHRAAASGSVSCLQLLLDKGADPDVYNEDGVSPIMKAVINEHSDCVAVLLKAKADPLVPCFMQRFYTCLQIAISNGDLKTAKILLDFEPKLASMDGIESRNYTPIHIAATNGDIEGVTLLLSYEIDLINLKTKAGQTALDIAKEKGNIELTDLIIKHDAAHYKYGRLVKDRVRQIKVIKNLGYFITLDPKGQFVYFVAQKEREPINTEDEKLTEGLQLSSNRLKLHVSLPESDSEKLCMCCDIVNPILMKSKVNTFRMVQNPLKTTEILGQEGKVITINCFANPEKSTNDWKEICEQIVVGLLKSNIEPGHPFVNSMDNPAKLLKGSNNFIAYTYEVNQWPAVDLLDHIILDCGSLNTLNSEITVSLSANKI